MIESINAFCDQFGGKVNIVIIGLFFITFFLLNSFIRNNKIRIFLSFIAGIFLILQITSLYFTQSFINYQFFVHFNLKGVQGISGLYIFPILIGIILLILMTWLCYLSHFLIYKKWSSILKKHISSKTKSIVSIFILATSLTLIFIHGKFLTDSKSLISLFQTNSSTFEEVLEKNGFSDYVTPHKIIAEKGKNIIVISLESLEKDFLGGKFADLTPNLQKLKKNWTYFDLTQNLGSGWTSGSLYTYMTGFPAFFGIHGNKIFQTSYHSEISSISHVLKKAGYKNIYLNGDTNHSGVKEMLSTLQFHKIIDKNSVDNIDDLSVYGIRDKDLFALAKEEILQQSGEENPFAVFISTTDSHFPNGIYDKRMEEFISDKENGFEFMVAALDYLIGDFISFLSENGILENTSVFIFPDHLKMGDPSMFESVQERGLYVITNAQEKELKITDSPILYQIDLPKILLNGAGISHNLKFLTDFISGNKDEFIENNISLITEINTTGLLRYGQEPLKLKTSDNYDEYKIDRSRYIAHAGGKIDGYIYTNSKEAMDLSYEKGFRMFELDIAVTSDGEFVAAHDWDQWKEITGFKGDIPVSKDEFLKHKIYDKYSPLDINQINEWFTEHEDAILVTDKINTPIPFSNAFVDPSRLIMELFSMDAVKEGLEANIMSAMPSQFAIRDMTIEDVKELKEIGVKNIAISRTFIADNKALLKEFQKYGIKPYAFHVNYIEGINEDYVTRFEMDYIYGIYADDWSFE